MNNADFTVLVSAGGRCCWVSMCTVWPLHSKWLSGHSNKSTSNFALSLNIPLQKLFRWFRRPQLRATGDWKLHHDNVPAHASCLCRDFWWNIKSLRWLSPLQSRLGALRLLAFPKSKNHLWKGRDFRPLMRFRKTGQGSWWQLGELCEVSDAYFEGDWGVIVLCTMFIVSYIFFNKCLCFS